MTYTIDPARRKLVRLEIEDLQRSKFPDALSDVYERFGFTGPKPQVPPRDEAMAILAMGHAVSLCKMNRVPREAIVDAIRSIWGEIGVPAKDTTS